MCNLAIIQMLHIHSLHGVLIKFLRSITDTKMPNYRCIILASCRADYPPWKPGGAKHSGKITSEIQLATVPSKWGDRKENLSK